MFYKIKIILIIVIISSMFFGLAKAANDKLSEPMVGSSSITFNGQGLNLTADNSYSKFANYSNPGGNLGSTNFVVMAWIKTNSASINQTQQIIGTTGSNVSSCGAGSEGWSFGLSQRNGDATQARLQMFLCDGSRGGLTQVSYYLPWSSINDGNWHLVTFAWQKTTGSIPAYFRYFLDNAYEGDGNSSVTGSVYSNTNNIFFGGTSGAFIGYIDEVRIFQNMSIDISTSSGKSSLQTAIATATSTKEDSNSDVGAALHGTSVALWDFNKGVVDTNPTGNPGILRNGAIVNGPNVVASAPNYFGFAANEVVLNYQGSGQAVGAQNNGYAPFGFDPTSALSCIPSILTGNNCFALNSSSSNMSIMNSRTSIDTNGTPAPLIETATLLDPSAPLIVGDSYLGSTDPNNFAYWGRNLTQSGSGTTASPNSFWGIGNYTMNPNSQSLQSGTSYAQYVSKINELTAQATAIPPTAISNVSSINLQGSSLSDNTNSEKNKYPEGKIWKVVDPTSGNLTNCGDTTNVNNIRTTINYSGRGTIICSGMFVNSGVNIVRSSTDPSASLGIISMSQNTTVVGGEYVNNIRLSGQNKIYAAVFSLGNIDIYPNSSFYGSFVAQAFNWQGGAAPTSTSNDQFYYDYKLDSNWPPGFRYLNMPHPQESN